MKTKQIVIVDVDRGRVSYDLYEIRETDRRGHGVVIDDEPAESVIDRLNAYFGERAIVAATRSASPASTSRRRPST